MINNINAIMAKSTQGIMYNEALVLQNLPIVDLVSFDENLKNNNELYSSFVSSFSPSICKVYFFLDKTISFFTLEAIFAELNAQQ